MEKNQWTLDLVIFITVQKDKNYCILVRFNDVFILILASTVICLENIVLRRQWLARVSSDCALVSPVVTKTVDPDWSVSTEGTDRNLHLLSIHLALFNKRLCHPSLMYCPSPFSCVGHSTGNYSIIFAQIPWPESVIQIPSSFLIGGMVLIPIWINPLSLFLIWK